MRVCAWMLELPSKYITLDRHMWNYICTILCKLRQWPFPVPALTKTHKKIGSVQHFSWLAEATSYRAAIRTAKGFVRDVGEAAARRSGGIVELSKINEHHSERDGHQLVSKKYGLSLPIPLSNLPKTPGVRYPGEFKVIRLRDWAQYIVSMNCWHILVGLQKPNRPREQDILREFWARYRQIHPTHQLWKVVEERGIDLSLLAPMLMHGDEGRGGKNPHSW